MFKFRFFVSKYLKFGSVKASESSIALSPLKFAKITVSFSSIIASESTINGVTNSS